MTSFHVGFLFFFFFLVIAPMVKFLREHMDKSGCVLGDKFIKAVRCNKKIGGGSTRGHGVFNIYSIVFGLSLVFCYYQSWSFCIYTLEFSNFVIEIFASICSWDFMKLYYCFLNVFFLLSLVQEWHCVMIMLC